MIVWWLNDGSKGIKLFLKVKIVKLVVHYAIL